MPGRAVGNDVPPRGPGEGQGLPYGSGPSGRTDGRLYTRRGGRGFYFDDPNGHVLEVMTVPETGS